MRIAAIIAASVAGLFSLGLLAAGGVLLWGDSKKDDQGYLSTSTHRFAGDGYALASDNLDLDFDGFEYGKVRIKADAGEPVFVGIARTADVERYLAGTAHTVVEDVSFDPFEADYRDRPGSDRPAAPASQDFWAASTHGAGTQTLTWDVEDGDWSVVVMNADGSRGVDAGVSAGATLGFLAPLGWGLLIAGLLVLGVAATLTVVAVRSRRREPVAV